MHVFYMKDSLHHIPDIERFFDDAVRCLSPSGGIVCVEPYWGAIAQLIFRFFHPEPYSPSLSGWSFASSGHMDANQALLWKLLRRDRDLFVNKFPQLEIVEIGPLIGPSYILSGGATARPLLPVQVLFWLHDFEVSTNFWRRTLALGFLCVFRRRK